MADNNDSVYDMGSNLELTQNDCNYVALAKEILTLKYMDTEELNADMKSAIESEAIELATIFYRDGGYLSQIKSHLNLDLELFDENNPKDQCEKYKILYLFYMLKHRHFPRTEVIELLGKQSMENIDNAPLHWKTYNGNVVKRVKDSLVKELNPLELGNINGALNLITTAWDNYLGKIRLQIDWCASAGYECDLDEIIHLLEPIAYMAKNIKSYELSPIGTLYLRILQNEQLGQIKDILIINGIQIKSNYNVPLQMIDEMKNLHSIKIKISNVEDYIHKNAKKIAKYVYIKTDISKQEQEKIRYNRKKLHFIFDFCIRARPLINMDDEVTELLVISCLQAILTDSKNETFDYIFHGYQDHMKHKPQVQGALKNDGYTVDALKIYWTRKVIDHWYANIGRYDLRCRLRELENVCDNILMQILSCSNISEMLEIHCFYYNKITQ